MGKQKGENARTKNRASSSSLAASMVPEGSSGMGFGGYFGSSKIELSSSAEESPSFLNVDNELAQQLKRLSRKDPTTKVKALSALSLLFKQKPMEEIMKIIPQWAYDYKRLLLDYNREVRRATHDTMAALVVIVRKGLAPHLKSLMGPWWIAQFDPIYEVSRAARCSLEIAFPAAEKRFEALNLCVDAIFVYIDENLKLTPQTMSDKATPMDELEDMHHRVISCSLTALATLIDILLSKKHEHGAEIHTIEEKHASKGTATAISAAEKLFFAHNCFLDFFKHKSPAVRSASYSSLSIYIKCIPHVYNEENAKLLSAAIFGAFQEKDYSCHSSMWDVILRFSKTFPEAWLLKNNIRRVLNGLSQFLSNGCYGSQTVSFPVLVVFLQSVPPEAVNGERFLLGFFTSFWVGRNLLRFSANYTDFFETFRECFLWAMDNTPRFMESKEDQSLLSKKLITGVLIELLWYDYLPANSKDPSENSSEIMAEADSDLLSNDELIDAQNYSSSYIHELGKCMLDILTHISPKEFDLLPDFFSTFVKDCQTVLRRKISSKITLEHLERIIRFFLLLVKFPSTKDQTWPWEFLGGPLIASSFAIIKAQDSVEAVELLSTLIEIFDPIKVMSHIYISSEEFPRLSSTNSDEDCRTAHFLQTFQDDFIPWCLQNHSSSSSAKLDLLLSLIQDEHHSDQWSAIIKYLSEFYEQYRTDAQMRNHADIFRSFTMLFEKLRVKVNLMKMESTYKFGTLPDHWHHDLLDSVALSIVCKASCFCFSCSQFLRAILGGSVEDDNICFVSREAVKLIFEEIFRILICFLDMYSSFEWAKVSSSSLARSSPANTSAVLSAKSAKFDFQVLEGSLFCLKSLNGNTTLTTSIVAAVFIIEWDFSISSPNRDDDCLEERFDAESALKRRVHAICDAFRAPTFRSLCSSSELSNMLVEAIRFSVLKAQKLGDEESLCFSSVWVMDLVEVSCQDYDDLQCLLDQLLSEADSWPLWVAPVFEGGRRAATLRHIRKNDENIDLSHGRFASFASKLISNLGVQKVIVGCAEEVPFAGALTSGYSYSRVWLAAELLYTWTWKGGDALSSIIAPLSKLAKDEKNTSAVKIILSLVNILFDGALEHAADDHWAAFCSWICSDDGAESIEEPFLRAIVFVLHEFIVKDYIWGRLENSNLVKLLLDKLCINGEVSRGCLRIIPCVMSFLVRSSAFRTTELDRFVGDASLESFQADDLKGSIVKWLENAVEYPPLHFLEAGNEETVEWIQVILACYPLLLQGQNGHLKFKTLRNISKKERNLLLALFRKQQISTTALNPSSSSALNTVLLMRSEALIAKLTAITVAYCWENLSEEDCSFLMSKMHKWLEPSVLIMEEMAEIADDILTSNNVEFSAIKLEQVVQSFNPLSASLSATSLVIFFLLSALPELENADSVEIPQSIKRQNWLEVKDEIMESALRLFLTVGVIEAIAKSCCGEASSMIASCRPNYSHFWSLAASMSMNAPDHVKLKAAVSMERWGLSKGPISALYAILFSSRTPSSLQFAAYNFLSTNSIIRYSILKESFIQGGISEQYLCLRDEISSMVLKPVELSEIASPPGHDKVNVFLAWALLLTHLHSLPSSSAEREIFVQFIHDSVSSTILDCVFEHISLKTTGGNLKKKGAVLSGHALLAANAAKFSAGTGAFMLKIESFWPIGTAENMASLAGSLYGMIIRLLPSYVRNWFTELRDRSSSLALEQFTKVWCSPSLISDELSQVKETVFAEECFSLTVNKSACEIIATYKKDEVGMDLVIRLPSCHPLRPVEIECTRSLGVSEVKQRKWLLSLTSIVRHQNGAVAEAIRKWKGNFDKEFEGVEECPICYSTIHAVNHSLPRLACSTCKHRFHSSCLYKWFSTSHKSTCPLCQTPF